MPAFITALLAKPYILVLIAIVVLGGGYLLYQGNGGETATLTIELQDFKQQVNVTGTVVAAERVDLGFAESGRISAVYAKVGDRVGAGAVLTAIENGELAAAVAQKEAALETERAKLLSLQEGARPEQIALDEAAVTKYEAALRDAIRSAYVSADDAVRKKADQFFANPRTPSPSLTFSVSNAILKTTVEQERVVLEQMLVAWAAETGHPSFTALPPENASAKGKGYLTQVATFLAHASDALAQGQSASAAYQVDINTARTTIASALASLSSSEGALADARGDLALSRAGSSSSDIAAQAATVKSAEANVAAARAALARTLVRAPFTGTVSKMDVKPGEIVSANTSAISLISNGAFQIETYVAQLNVSSVEPGDEASVTLDAYGPSVEFMAKVLSVDPAETVREGVTTYKTTLAFLSTDARIRSGMSANVAITIGERPGAIIIPRGALLFEDSRSYVTMAETAENREVTLGADASLGRVEVLSGLTPGDVILLTP